MTELWFPVFWDCAYLKYNRASENEDDILPEIDMLQREYKEQEELDARDLLTTR